MAGCCSAFESHDTEPVVFVSQVFEELLLDADWSVNAGSWMWLSCSSFFQQFFHCYCPVGFGRRTDPNGDFIRWVPFYWYGILMLTPLPPRSQQDLTT